MRPLTALCLVLAGAAAIAGSIALQPISTAAPEGSGQRVIAADLTSATRIEMIGATSTATIQKTDTGWGVAERDLYPAQPARLRTLFAGLAELRRTEPRTADPAAYARLGVDDPTTAQTSTASTSTASTSTAILLRITTPAPKPIEILLGHRLQRGAGSLPESVYLRTQGDPQSWLAEGALPVDPDPRAWLVPELIDLPGPAIQTITLLRGTDRQVFTRTGDHLTVTPAPGKPDQDRIDAVTEALHGLTLADVKKGPPPGTQIGTAAFTTTDALILTLTLSRDADTLWATIDATGPGADAYAPLKNWSFLLPGWREQTLLPKPADLATP